MTGEQRYRESAMCGVRAHTPNWMNIINWQLINAWVVNRFKWIRITLCCIDGKQKAHISKSASTQTKDCRNYTIERSISPSIFGFCSFKYLIAIWCHFSLNLFEAIISLILCMPWADGHATVCVVNGYTLVCVLFFLSKSFQYSIAFNGRKLHWINRIINYDWKFSFLEFRVSLALSIGKNVFFRARANEP